jgi:hypothetical protein
VLVYIYIYIYIYLYLLIKKVRFLPKNFVRFIIIFICVLKLLMLPPLSTTSRVLGRLGLVYARAILGRVGRWGAPVLLIQCI